MGTRIRSKGVGFGYSSLLKRFRSTRVPAVRNDVCAERLAFQRVRSCIAAERSALQRVESLKDSQFLHRSRCSFGSAAVSKSVTERTVLPWPCSQTRSLQAFRGYWGQARCLVYSDRHLQCAGGLRDIGFPFSAAGSSQSFSSSHASYAAPAHDVESAEAAEITEDDGELAASIGEKGGTTVMHVTPPPQLNVNMLFTLARGRKFDKMLALHTRLVEEEMAKAGANQQGDFVAGPLFQSSTYKNLADVCGSFQGSEYIVPLFHKMLAAGVTPDVPTYGAAIKGCVRLVGVLPLTVVSARIRKGEKVRLRDCTSEAPPSSHKAVADALYLLSHMRKSGTPRNFIIYLPLLGPLSTMGMSSELVDVIKWMIEDKVEMEAETVTRLVGKSRVGAIAMSALVWGWIRAGKVEKALETLRNARRQDWELHKALYEVMLEYCLEAKVYHGLEEVLAPLVWDERCMGSLFGQLGQQALIDLAAQYVLYLQPHMNERSLRRERRRDAVAEEANAAARGYPPTMQTAKLTYLMNLFLTTYGRNHTVEEMKAVIKQFNDVAEIEPSHVSYNIMISSACRHGDMMKALDLVEEAHKAGLVLTTRTFNPILGGFARSRLIDEAFELLGAMERLGVVPNVVTYSTLIHACATSDQVESAYTVLSEMVKKDVKRNVYSYNPLIAAFGSRGQLKRALDVLHELKNDGVEPNDITYALMIRACGIVKNVEKAFELYKEMLDSGIKPSSNVDATLLTACSRSGETARALEVYQQMEQRGVEPDRVISSALLLGLAAHGMPKEALELYKKMRGKGLWPKPGAVACLMYSLGKSGELEKVFEIFEEMKDPKAYLDISPYEREVYYHGRCIMLITACIRNSQLEKALNFLKEIQKEGKQNEAVMFDQLLMNCSYPLEDGARVRWLDVDDGFAVLDAMRKLGLRPSRIGLEALIDCCQSMGNADRAEQVAKMMEKEGLPFTIFTLIRLLNAYVSGGDQGRAIEMLNRMSGQDLYDRDVQLLIRKIMQPYFEAATESPEKSMAAETLPEVRSRVQEMFASLRSHRAHEEEEEPTTSLGGEAVLTPLEGADVVDMVVDDVIEHGTDRRSTRGSQ